MPITTLILASIALLYSLLAVRAYLKNDNQLPIAVRIWLRIAVIFSAVAIGLYLLL